MLNRNPVNYFAEVEQLAFDPSNMPPGIEPSPDKMLQVCLNYCVTKPMKQPTQTHFTSSFAQASDAQKDACSLFCLRAKHLSSAYL